jgi:hypothetical protein
MFLHLSAEGCVRLPERFYPMDKKMLNAVCLHVFSHHPEVRNTQPNVTEQEDGKFLVIFTGTAFGANGKPIPRTVRAVVDTDGKIIKLSSSR